MTVLWLTSLFFFIELAGGLYYNSLALVTDASFMAFNITGQFIALYAKWLSQKTPDRSKTFGYERAKVLSGLFTGAGLGFVLFYVLFDAAKRIASPEPLDAGKVLYIAIAGLLVNGYGILKLLGHSTDIDIRGPFLLILNDTLGSVGVILSSLIIRFTGLYVIDAITSVLIGLLILFPTYHLIKQSIDILMEGSPSGVDIEKVEGFLRQRLPGIRRIDGLHIWAIVPEKTLLAAKIVTDGEASNMDQTGTLRRLLKKQFGFHEVYLDFCPIPAVENRPDLL
jgi:cobalt-zinc-cadmium efflux system protein